MEFHKYLKQRQQKHCCGLVKGAQTDLWRWRLLWHEWSTLRTACPRPAASVQMFVHFPAENNTPQPSSDHHAFDPSQGHWRKPGTPQGADICGSQRSQVRLPHRWANVRCWSKYSDYCGVSNPFLISFVSAGESTSFSFRLEAKQLPEISAGMKIFSHAVSQRAKTPSSMLNLLIVL